MRRKELTMSPRPIIRYWPRRIPRDASQKLRGKISFKGRSNFLATAIEIFGMFNELATVCTGLEVCRVATVTITLEPNNCSEKNTQKISYTNRHTRSRVQTLMLGNRTWLTKAMQRDMPSTLFKNQCPVTIQLATTPKQNTASVACERVIGPNQLRLITTTSPKRAVTAVIYGAKVNPNDNADDTRVKAMIIIDTDENK